MMDKHPILVSGNTPSYFMFGNPVMDKHPILVSDNTAIHLLLGTL